MNFEKRILPRHVKKTILITVDVEDWYQVENLRPWFPPDSWDSVTSRVEQNTHRLLDLLDAYDHKISATFFVLGWVALRYPALVREIAQRGHEVASHGFGHMLNNRMKKDDLIDDLQRSKKMLEDLTGQLVEGYRAPSFSVDDDILKLIRECGYRYDSSYNSFERHGRYGTISTDEAIQNGIALQMAGGIEELPVSNLSLAGQTIPWGGGGYFRFFPPRIFAAGVKRILERGNAYLFYLHPWEIDPDQPRVPEARGLSGWRHYLNLDKTLPRLANFFERFRYCEYRTCSSYLKQLDVTRIR